MRTAVLVVSGLVVLGALSAGGAYGYYAWTVGAPAGEKAAEPIVFEVEKGDTLRKLGDELRSQGLLRDALVWRVYLKLNPQVPSPKAGKHEVHAGMNIPQLIEALGAKPLSEDVPLTMVEGWRLRDADAFLAERGLITSGEYLSASRDPSRFRIPFKVEGKDLAGYLLPETYLVPPGRLDVDELIQRQIDQFNARFVKAHEAELKKSKRSLRAVVIMASMLEREEPKPRLRPEVAGVLYNRLDANTPLGVDATSRFTLDDWNNRRKFLKKLRDPKDPYNTRLKAGLPPGPIGAPSLPSLKAALRPKKTPYWYYLHDANQQIHFARTAKEHEANRKKYNVY